MAVPKQKTSKSRTKRRKAGKKITISQLVKCSHCGKMIASHKVCPFCGYYKEREIIDVLAKKN